MTVAKIIASVRSMRHTKVNSSILQSALFVSGFFNIKIDNILKNHSLEIQKILFNLDTFNSCSKTSRHLSIFNKVKSNFNINADDQSIIDFLIADNKHINKQSKKKKSVYKNEIKTIVSSITFKSLIGIDSFK